MNYYTKFILIVTVKQSKNLLYNLRKEQNVKELEMLKLKEQEEKLIGKLEIMHLDQFSQYSKVKKQVEELEITINSQKQNIDYLVENYINDNNDFDKNLTEVQLEKLEKLRREYLDHLKSFEIITFNNFEKEKLYKDSYSRQILDIKYQEMNKLHKNYKMKEIEIIKEYLKTSSRDLLIKTDNILQSQNLYQNLYKHYILRRNELGQYQEAIKKLKKIEEEFYEKKNNFYESRVKGAVSSVNLIYKIV